MDFAGWFEAYLDGRWYTFDPRNNTPRMARVLLARGRDAADVPISNAFGRNTLQQFVVRTEEVRESWADGGHSPQAPHTMMNDRRRAGE
jgi:transglutaminase-like putative cysteine protease